MKVILFLVGFLTVAFAEEDQHTQLSPADAEVARLALQNPDLYDGDMAGIDGPFDPERSAIVGDNYRWPGARVPYIIDGSVSGYRNLIQDGINEIHRHTCVRFTPRSFEQDYINIFAGQGCYSMVGRVKGRQALSLGNGCMYVGTVIHEFLHALGFYHEQSRSDRDQYLIIYLENVSESMRSNFFKLQSNQNILYNTFDYNSIMIYGNKSFSMNGRDTMVARNGQKLLDPYDKKTMTRADIERINKMYNCR